VTVAAGVALAVAVSGLGAGALWQAVAPRVEIVRTDRGFEYGVNQLEKPVAADGSFLFVGLGAGVLLAALAWALLRRHRGVAVLIGLAVGSFAGAWLAWRFGIWLDDTRFESAAATAPVGAHLDAPLSLRATGLDADALWPPKLTGVVATQPLVAAIVYTMLAGFSSDPHLRPASEWEDEPEDAYVRPAPPPLPGTWTADGVSWDPAARPDQPARPAPPGNG
jgi:hypothetical protein